MTAVKAVSRKSIRQEFVAELLADYRKPEDLIGEHGLLKQLTQEVGGSRPGSRDGRALGPGQKRVCRECRGPPPQREAPEDAQGRVG